MEIFLICSLLVVVIYFRSKIKEIEAQQFASAASKIPEPAEAREEIHELTVRLMRLEREVATLKGTVPKTAIAPAVPVFIPQQAATLPETVLPHTEPEPVMEAATPVEEPRIFSEPQTSLGDRLHAWLGDEEWEALLGGSLLNKIGALVLVIGIALFLGYSFTHMTPAGRALTSLGVSLGLLGGGLWFERNRKFTVFARGLVAAGWAALYVTCYAMYALPAAKLIQTPVLGSTVLLMVSAAMVMHSLRYRSQTVTAVAFFTTFAALAVTPSSILAVLALLPLTIALLVIAYRYEWSAMALFGAIATYATCLLRGQPDATLVTGQSLFLAYWLAFEGFDLIRTHKRQRQFGVGFLFPINTLGFLGLSDILWMSRAPDQLWMTYAGAAVLYLSSAAYRYYLRLPSSFTEGEDLTQKLLAGSFEGAGLVAACLSAAAIAVRATGEFKTVGFAAEAEVLYLAAIYLSAPVFRVFSYLGFTLSLGCWLADSSDSTGHLHNPTFSPVALLHASLFYVNRLLRKPNVVFSSLAAGLIATVLAVELREELVGPSWIVFGLLLFELGFRKQLLEFRWQAYALALCGCGLTIISHIVSGREPNPLALLAALVAVYAVMLRIRFATTSPLSPDEGRGLEFAGSAIIASLATSLTLRLAPSNYRGLMLVAVSLLLFDLGLRNLPALLKYFAYALAVGGAALLVTQNSWHFNKFPALAGSLSYAGAALSAYWMTWRANRMAGQLASTAGCAFALATLWLVLPDTMVPVAWSVFAGALFFLGRRWTFGEMRWQGYFVMTAAVGNVLFEILDLPDLLWGVHAGVVCAALVATICYACQLLSPPMGEGVPKGWPGWIDAHPRVFWSLLGTLVLTLLLWHQFPGGLLTTAWGVEALALLAVGFPLRQRALRLQGLGMLLLCVLKLFCYDLRNLETLYRILSFVALGVMLLGVSWIYTRFREQLKRFL